MHNMHPRFIKSAKKTQLLHDLLRDRGRLKPSDASSVDAAAAQPLGITPYPPPALPCIDDFWDFAGAPPPTRRVTNVALPPQQPRGAMSVQSEGDDEKVSSGGKQQQQQQQQHGQSLSEAQLEKILTLTDEALLRALSKCDDDDLRVSCVSCHSHLTPHTSHLTPQTSNLTPQTSHLTPQTSNLTPQTSHLTPQTSNLTPQTSHLTPQTSHLKPHTYHSVSCASCFGGHCSSTGCC